MKSILGHLQLNVSNPEISFPFYKDFLKCFDYKIIVEEKEYLGLSNGTTDFWIQAVEDKYKMPFHRKSTGINHIAFRVDAKEDVDKFFNEFIKPRNVKTLYETPKSFPEYAENYYAIFFEDPDRIKIEVLFY